MVESNYHGLVVVRGWDWHINHRGVDDDLRLNFQHQNLGTVFGRKRQNSRNVVLVRPMNDSDRADCQHDIL
jgi:hypothetical protein